MAKLILGSVLKRKKMTKMEFAKRMGIKYAAVFAYFRPTYNPTFRMMERWAKVLGVRIRDLFQE
jgi:transcriptional regulator with XRE-family HTH domain